MPFKHSVLNVKVVEAAFNQEKALVGAFSVITNLRIELFEALVTSDLKMSRSCCGGAEAGPGLELTPAWT